MAARSPSPDISLSDRTSDTYDFSANSPVSSDSRPSTLRSQSNESLRQGANHATADVSDEPQRRDHHSRFREEGDENSGDVRVKNRVPEINIVPAPNHPASGSQISLDQKKQLLSWLPLTLQNSFLGLLSLLALVLCAVTIALLVTSRTNYGLGSDDGSSKILFGWRFSPTLVAVIYIQLTAMLVDDVKRLEPFARLAGPEGSEASSSILQKPGAWWNALHDGFSKRKNGGSSRGWVLLCATLVNVLGFLLISPLSSALLVSVDVTVPLQTDFLRLTPRLDAPLSLSQSRIARFRTISHFAQNVSTSPWVTDKWTMLPVWPSARESPQFGSLPSTQQTWTAETTVFKSNHSCNKMKLESSSSKEVISGNDRINATFMAITTVLSSGDCRLEFTAIIDNGTSSIWTDGGASWSNVTGFNASTGLDMQSAAQSKECTGHDYLMLVEGNSTLNVHLCATTYSMSNVTALIDLSGSEPNISFNESEYIQNQQTVPDALMSTKMMRDQAVDPDWKNSTLTLDFDNSPWLYGPARLLWVIYKNNLTAMIEDKDMTSRAAEIQQRFFGEMIQSSLTERGASQYLPIQGHVRTLERRVTTTAGPAITLIILLFLSFCLLLITWRCSRIQHRPLNLKTDPASLAGATSLLVESPRTRHNFKDFNRKSDKELQSLLEGKRYYTDPGILHETIPDQSETVNQTMTESRQESTSRVNWIPGVLRLPALLVLLVCLVAVVTGVVVLYHFAQLSELYGKAFVYQANISIFDKQLSTVGPFSMIPTIIAVCIGLWWGVIDSNFCRLQPYLAMAKRYRPLSESVHLSYQSSYWMWATIKALKNRHWMLVWVTLGTAISPIFTTTMSALFQRDTGVTIQTKVLERSLEIRQIPHVFKTEEYTVRFEDSFMASIIAQLHGNLSSHWMYTAANQLTLNASEPAWSKDGWSFVPVDLSTVSLPIPEKTLDINDQGGLGKSSQINVSLATPAIRGRVECSPYEGLLNLSAWLTPTDVSNSSTWSLSPSAEDLKMAYELGVGYKLNGYRPSMIFPEPSDNYTSCVQCTPIFANPSMITCCGNGTDTGADPMAAVGYWSPNGNPGRWSVRTWSRNFTTKWIHGHARSAIELIEPQGTELPHLLFTNIPSITAMNCMPLVETANAEVTVDPATGAVRAFEITEKPKVADNAFSDVFLPHRTSDQVLSEIRYNATVSYGVLFMTQMLTAANVQKLYGASRLVGWTVEDTSDSTFNIRDEAHGLNMDFMSYSMYSLAGNDPAALLDPTVFSRLSSKTFSTFFQHFANSNISMKTGSWAYQPINASLPSDLTPAVTDATLLEDAPLTAYQDEIHPISHTNRTVVVRVSQRVEMLKMNAVAVWLSVSILAWLIIATLIVTIFHRQYLRRLIRNVECLGDMLILTAGSESLVHMIREMQAGKLTESEERRLCARLGWFQDGDGNARWGVELLEGYMGRPPVRWLNDDERKNNRGEHAADTSSV
ncbi:hypothetical protein NYO67_12157 [Aspergillus flavus]|nr:hypothetical protein NYO67_12157 [Aspergillus flavus]